MKKLYDLRLEGPQCLTLKPVELVHKNPWFKVQNRGGYYTVEYRSPQVIVLPIVEDHSIVMVRVKRPVIADSPLELPAGGAKENEEPVDAAVRELFEETGILVKDSSRIHAIPPIAGSPNRNPELLHIFQVELSTEEVSSRKEHDREIEKVEILNFGEVCSKIMSGDIYVAVPIAVISRYFLSIAGLNE